MNAWELIKQYLESKIGPEAFQNWILRTTFLGQENRSLRVSVPDNVTKDWLEQDYAAHIRTAISKLSLPIETIRYELASASDQFRHDTQGAIASDDHGFTPASQLNPKFSFDNFVVGSCN